MPGWTSFCTAAAVMMIVSCGGEENGSEEAAASEEPATSGATIGAEYHGIYTSDPDVNCTSGGATLVVTATHVYAESEDSTCVRSSAVTAAESDGPFALLTLTGKDSIRLKTRPDGLSVSGDDAGYLAGTWTRDTTSSDTSTWTSGAITEIPAELQAEFQGCSNVNCTNGVLATLTSTSFYTESTDSTCMVLSGKATSMSRDGPYTLLTLADGTIQVRKTSTGIRISGEDAGFLEGDYHGPGTSCPGPADGGKGNLQAMTGNLSLTATGASKGNSSGRTATFQVEIYPTDSADGLWDLLDEDGTPDVAICVNSDFGKQCYPDSTSESGIINAECQDSFTCTFTQIPVPDGAFQMSVVDVDGLINEIVGSATCDVGSTCTVGRSTVVIR